GLHCSLCTGTIEKALGRLPGVHKVAVSLTHEQALVEYDPAVARPEQLLQTLRDIGYSISDPRKVRAFEEEERDLVREGRRFVVAVTLSVAAIPIIADPAAGCVGFLPALVCLSLGGFVFLVLRSSGLWVAIGAAGGPVICRLGDGRHLSHLLGMAVAHREDPELAGGKKASGPATADCPRRTGGTGSGAADRGGEGRRCCAGSPWRAHRWRRHCGQ